MSVLKRLNFWAYFSVYAAIVQDICSLSQKILPILGLLLKGQSCQSNWQSRSFSLSYF